MRYTTILFDVDCTLVDSSAATVESFRRTARSLGLPPPDAEACDYTFTHTSEDSLAHIGAKDIPHAMDVWNRHILPLQQALRPYEGICEVVRGLKDRGCRLGIVTSRTEEEVLMDPSLEELLPCFDARVCADHTVRHKPDPEPLEKAIALLCAKPGKTLYVGDSPSDAGSARGAGIDFALALWGTRPGNSISADHYLSHPSQLLTVADHPDVRWLDWARELQAIAQIGLAYSRDDFDRERFERVREIAAAIMAAGSGLSIDRIRNLFCGETGYQTPKLDVRAALFEGEKILLVQESDGTWSLPGGWVDIHTTVAEAAVKEIREEAGLEASVVKLIAIQDRNRHNTPAYAYGITKVFLLCRALGGAFQQNTETLAADWFALDQLPPLSLGRTTEPQLRMCFAARSPQWQPVVD